MTLSFLLLLTFLAATLGVAAASSVCADLFRRDRGAAYGRMGQEFNRSRTADNETPKLVQDWGTFDLGALALPGRGPELAQSLPQQNSATLSERFRAMLAQSGLSITPAQLLLASGSAAAVLSVTGTWFGGIILGLIGAVGGATAPLLFVRTKQVARERKFLKQLPDAFDLMARVLRAGHSVPQAFQTVAETFEPPLSGDFARCQEQQNLGLLPETAFRQLAQRTGNLEMKIFAMAMKIQRQTGGNLTDVLLRLSDLTRKRLRLRNQIRTLTAEGRLQALVLLVLPPLMFLAMRMINRRYADVLLEHGGLLALTGLSMLVGAVWIRKIINIDI